MFLNNYITQKITQEKLKVQKQNKRKVQQEVESSHLEELKKMKLIVTLNLELFYYYKKLIRVTFFYNKVDIHTKEFEKRRK